MNLDLDDIQLLLIDLQPSIIANSRTNAPETISAAAVALARAAKILGWPVTASVVPQGGKQGAMIAELATETAKVEIFTRTVTNPFMVAEFSRTLSNNGRKTLIVSGVSTEVAVLQTSCGAIAAGYKAYVPVDAIGSRSERTEAAALREMERAGVVTTSVRSLLLRLTPDLSKAPGTEILKALGAL